jgi:Zn-dependent protease with chaperone function
VRVADNETEPNALALPNGTIIVTKGLLRLAETQDELDFVLAHEAAQHAAA